VAGEPDGGDHVDLEVAPPGVVVDLEHGLGREDPEVVDEDVGQGVEHGLRALRGREVGGDALHAELGRDLLDALGLAAVDRHRGPPPRAAPRSRGRCPASSR
jgi:hypothetical protein